MPADRHPAPILPPVLKSGDTIAVAAPASPFDRQRLEAGVSILKSWGYRVLLPDTLFQRQGYLAGDDRLRAEQLNRLFGDPHVKAIICARGGYGSLRMLDLIDFDTVGSNPKRLVGFSDITALLAVLNSRCRLVTFHGPLATTLADMDPLSQTALQRTLSANGVEYITLQTPVVLAAGKATGSLGGGNLTTLCHLTGTPFAPDFDGAVVFFEDRGEPPYRIDRMLTHMKLAGHFKNLAGILLGDFDGCGSFKEICAIFKDTFRHMGIPILAGLPAGHGSRNLTLPIGLTVEMDTDAKRLSFAPLDHAG